VNSTVRKNLHLLILLSFGLLLNGCGKKEKAADKTKAGPPPAPRVEGYVVKVIPVAENLELPGSIIANEATEIHPEISGRLTYLNTAEGKVVGKGTLIAKIYDGDLRAQLNKLNVQLRVQEQTAKRYEELLKINGVSQQEYDMIRLQSNNIRADIAIVQSNIMRTEIRAPFSGTLGLKVISPGAYVTPATVLTTIRQNNELKLDFTLPEKFTGQLRPGQLVSFTSEGNSKIYNAKVTATESGISEESRSLRVRAAVVNNDRNLLPGAFAKVKIGFEPDPNAIMIPSQAIVPQARGKKVVVYRGGTISFEDVVTGVRDSAMVQITNGLKVGDTIITTGLMSLKPKAKVVLSKIKI
jgi:membrane fusion protein (multidrug efflux system)